MLDHKGQVIRCRVAAGRGNIPRDSDGMLESLMGGSTFWGCHFSGGEFGFVSCFSLILTWSLSGWMDRGGIC